jgi:hypothetical protein
METVWTMNHPKTCPPPGDMPKDRLLAVVADQRADPVLSAAFTLRVKPDRRRVQLPIAPQLDRRRKR